MQSVFANLLINIYDRITEQVPEIKMIDQDFGQLENFPADGRPSVMFPCLLIDFTDTSYKDKQQGAQWGEMSVSFRLGVDTYSNSDNLSPATVQEKALLFYELENKLYVALQDWNGGGLLMTAFSRTRATTEKKPLNLFRVRAMSFKASYEDLGAAS